MLFLFLGGLYIFDLFILLNNTHNIFFLFIYIGIRHMVQIKCLGGLLMMLDLGLTVPQQGALYHWTAVFIH